MVGGNVLAKKISERIVLLLGGLYCTVLFALEHEDYLHVLSAYSGAVLVGSIFL